MKSRHEGDRGWGTSAEPCARGRRGRAGGGRSRRRRRPLTPQRSRTRRRSRSPLPELEHRAGDAVSTAVNVIRLRGPIPAVNVTLHRVGHSRPRDIGVLLVSPNADTVNVRSFTCGGSAIEDFTWILDQQAANPMPRGADCPGFVLSAERDRHVVLALPGAGRPARPAPRRLRRREREQLEAVRERLPARTARRHRGRLDAAVRRRDGRRPDRAAGPRTPARKSSSGRANAWLDPAHPAGRSETRELPVSRDSADPGLCLRFRVKRDSPAGYPSAAADDWEEHAECGPDARLRQRWQ